MFRNIKLTIEYDGTDFNGWQVQDKVRRTVAGEIEKTLKKIFCKDIRIIGSGRTDSGVHAQGQVANFYVDSPMVVDKIQRALNAHLPEDIAVISIEEVEEKFHAQYSVLSKTYRYTIFNRKIYSPLRQRFALFYPYPLNLSRMRAEAKTLIGHHDFRSFQAANPSRNKNLTTIRVIHKISIQKRSDLIHIDIEANGFLYKMVRNIVGTLLEVGGGHLLLGNVETILAKKDRSFAGDTAPAYGLMLMEVKY